MRNYSFHINLHHIGFLGMLFMGAGLICLLWFTKRLNQPSNRLLALMLTCMLLWLAGCLVNELQLTSFVPVLAFMPFEYSLALGPLIWLYTRYIINPGTKFLGKDGIHFIPVFVEFLLQLIPGLKLPQTYPVLHTGAFMSVVIYLILSFRLINGFYRQQPLQDGDRQILSFRWLHRWLLLFGACWLLWLPVCATRYWYGFTFFGSPAQSILYMVLAGLMIRLTARAFLQQASIINASDVAALKTTAPAALRQKAILLKQRVKDQRLYEDPELTLKSLAEKLGWSSHELSRVINAVLKKNFADFINEYRVADVIAKMKDLSNDKLTLLGIAWDAGFNSKSSFNRIFKESTGKTPVEFKHDLKKGVPDYQLRPRPRWETVISGAQTTTMFKNYWKTAWRNLLKHKFYSTLNIAGLGLGLAVGILVLLWVQDELSFDGFYSKAKDIYRLELWGGTGNNRQIFTIGVAPIGPFSKQTLPAVQDYARLRGNYDYSLFKYREKVFGDERAIYADPSLFSLFDLALLKGDNKKPFMDDNSVVLTQSTAAKFFGQEDPIGKVIVADGKISLTVSGVIADIPKNASIRYDMIMPISYHFKEQLAQHNDLSNNFSYLDYLTFLQVKPGTDLPKLAKQITGVHLAHKPDDTDAEYLLLPLSKMHLYRADGSDNGISTVRIFIAIAILILVIACINYVNLSTARAMLRAKEISMRKIIGAARTQLFIQFIVETTLLFMIAAILAIGLIWLFVPVFNTIAGKEMSFELWDYHVWFVLLAAITGTLIASSIYPALLLSSFEPLKALKGKITAGIGDVLFRKILVVAQFSVSIILITGTIVITRQLNFIRSTGAGYDKTHVLSLWMRDMDKHYDAVKSELLQEPAITSVTRSNQNIVHFQGFVGDVDWDGRDPKQNIIMHPIVVDRDLVSFFNMKLLAGTSFTGGQIDSSHFILNEAAIKEMGIKEPIGKRFRMGGTNGSIIGVVKDFHYASMKEKIAPSIFWYSPQLLNTMYVKTTATGAQKAIAALEKQFKHYNGEYPFGYAFLDDIFDNLYQSEQREGSLFTDFAAIAIFISCLGLLGLAAYTAQVRTKEIGLRKVLGASTSGIIRLLASDFIKLVGIAMLIAIPIAWYAMQQWLNDFAYKAPIQWWIFALAGGLAILVAFMTIGLQAFKAAVANPVKSLKAE